MSCVCVSGGDPLQDIVSLLCMCFRWGPTAGYCLTVVYVFQVGTHCRILSHCCVCVSGGDGDGSYLSEQLQASIQSRQAQIEELDKDLQERQNASAFSELCIMHLAIRAPNTLYQS